MAEDGVSFKLQAQLEKAKALYTTLRAAGADSNTIKAMGAEAWHLAATAAKVRYPSVDTRALVLGIAEANELATRFCDTVDAMAAAGEAPTAEEEDAAAGLDEDYDRVYEDRCDYVR